jgi:carbon storage regulator
MLTLTRKPGEKIVITTEGGEKIELFVSEIRRNQVRIKIDAPRTVTVMRLEIAKRIAAEAEEAAS